MRMPYPTWDAQNRKLKNETTLSMTLWYGRSLVSKNASEGRGDKPGWACGRPMCGDRMYARSAVKIGHTLTLRHDQRSEFHATVPTRGRQGRLQWSCDHGELP